MRNQKLSPLRNISEVVTLALLLMFGLSSWAQSGKLLYGFTYRHIDGEGPTSPIAFDAEGNIFGTTDSGGPDANGTVYKLKRSSGGWNESVLYSFRTGSDGQYPWGGVTIDQAGNVYGTTLAGGSGGSGTVFELSPVGNGWKETIIYNFQGNSDGSGPYAGLVFDKNGNLYGTTYGGGGAPSCPDTFGCGIVFELTPTQGAWAKKTVYAFQGYADGAYLEGGVILDRQGNLYGTTQVAGTYGSGTVFELTPHSDGAWTETTLYSFAATGDGAFPLAGVTFDPSGNLYGTTSMGGTNNAGIVFQLQHSQQGWTETMLHSFDPATEGSQPYSGITLDGAGNLYCTTPTGGAHNLGTIFALLRSNGSWKPRVVHTFTGGKDGGTPYDSLLFDGKSSLYGTTWMGGPGLEGIVFQLGP